MSSHTEVLEVTLGSEPGERLDKALAAAVPEGLGLSRSRLQALIANGRVRRAAGEILRDPKMRVWPAERLVLTIPPPGPAAQAPEDIPIDIAYEDAYLIVVRKPAGLVVHPAPGAESGTLVNALLHHAGARLSGIGGERRPGIVHRLDKDTSGLLVVAKTDAAHQGLARQFAAHDLERVYRAVVRGAPDPGDPRLAGWPGLRFEPGGVIRVEGNIGRHPGDRKRMAVVAGSGKPAVTRARVLERFGPGPGPQHHGRWAASELECRLETGRTHQIRVHLAHIGHPLVGDAVYGRRSGAPGGLGGLGPGAAAALAGFPRQALHAATLGFVHPVTGEAMRFDWEPPADFAQLLVILRDSGGNNASDPL